MNSSWNVSATLRNVRYTYGDSQWGDLLTAYNGEAITYDAIGNPLTYRDGITMTWQNGRELATFTNDDEGIEATFTYDPSGMRTKKQIANLSTTEYVYEDDLLLKMKYGTYLFTFSYDANGSPIGFKLSRTNSTTAGTYYYYGLNSRGDVVALYNASGTRIAAYSYDAYGKPLNTQMLLAGHNTAISINPLRYRGYVYDKETGLYYLQSRYYDPETCRFINEDGYVSIGVGLMGHNMFAYCNNNPIMSSDPTGELNPYDAGGGACSIPYSTNFGGGYSSGGACGSGGISTTIQYVRIIRPAITYSTVLGCGTGLAVSASVSSDSSKSNTTSISSLAALKQNRPKYVAHFTVNPNDFNPKGLSLDIIIPIGNGKNGGIYKWVVPGTKHAVFEWDEDYKVGSHYHVMMIEWDNTHHGDHYLPNSWVPEPWNSIYFGG